MAESSGQTKTEQPTPRRLEKSREKGQVAYSTDLTAGIVLLVISLSMMILTHWFFTEFTERLTYLIGSIGWCSRHDEHWLMLFQKSFWDGAVLSLPFAAIGFLTTVIVGGLITGFRFAPRALTWDVNKLDPVNGFKKIFSSRSVVRGAISIVKLLALSGIVFLLLKWQFSRISLSASNPNSMAWISWQLVTQIAVAVSAALVLIGLLDFMYQKWKHLQDMKMTRQELQDEHREDEGDPHLRARLKKLQREMSQRKMLADVPSATAVITNPTHLAIAIQYERGKMGAPKVIAKGSNHLAHKIVRIARSHGIAIVERKPLARMLFASVPVGAEVPLELYQAVAEVLAYIYRLEQSI